MKKLTRRESALVAHAKRRAVEDYKNHTWIRVLMLDGRLMHQTTLEYLRNLNILSGTHRPNMLLLDFSWPPVRSAKTNDDRG